MKTYGVSAGKYAAVVGLPRSTVVHFSSAEPFPPTRALSADENFIADAWNNAPCRARASLETFWSYFGKTYPEASFSYEAVRQTTLNLGLRSRKCGRKNEGVASQRTFAPLSYWAADGKNLDVSVNGNIHRHVWYAFGCAGTSFFVGASVNKAENSQAFLDALKDSQSSTGYFPIGVLVDNRLGRPKIVDLSSSEKHDLPADVVSFCKEHNIVVVHTWPGNPKSNIMENHFSVFAQHVKTIDVKGDTDEELGASIARAFVEAFMKVRNHTPRKRFDGQTPSDLVRGKQPDEGDRPAIEKLRDRVNKNQRSFEERWKLILPETLACFSSLDAEGNPPRRMRKLLRNYSHNEIIAAQAAFHAQREKHPDNKYGEDYFFGILRCKREERAKQVYADVFRAGIQIQSKLLSYNSDLRELASSIIKYLSDIEDEKIPLHQRYHLQALLFFLMSISHRVSLPLLWKTVLQGLTRSNVVSLRWFSTVQEFCHEHLGDLLYEFPPKTDKSSASPRAPPIDRQVGASLQ
jgi:hypothetical protein